MVKRIKRSPRRARWRYQRSGTQTVEMALVAPVILLLVFGSFEFSRVMMVRQALTNAAREGTRTACLVTTTNSADAEEAVRAALRAVVTDAANNTDIQITVEPSFTTAPPAGTTITTTVSVACSDISWLPPFFTAGATIRSSTSMDRE